MRLARVVYKFLNVHNGWGAIRQMSFWSLYLMFYNAFGLDMDGDIELLIVNFFLSYPQCGDRSLAMSFLLPFFRLVIANA